MIILANPNNPTSTLVPVAALRALCDEARDAIVVVDEAYVDFALAAGIDASMLPFLDAHPNLVVLRTLSKSYSLAGARLGLLFAAAPLVDALMKVKDSYNVNVISQALGVAALEDRAYYDECVRRTVAERARLETALDGHGPRRIPSRRPTSCSSNSASAPARFTKRSRTRGCSSAGGPRQNCEQSCESPSASPPKMTESSPPCASTSERRVSRSYIQFSERRSHLDRF